MGQKTLKVQINIMAVHTGVYRVQGRQYARYKSNPAYNNVEIDGITWGIKATHREQNFYKRMGWYEASVQNIGYNSGHKVILEAEPHDVFQQRSCEGLWGGKRFEVPERKQQHLTTYATHRNIVLASLDAKWR